MKQRFFSFVLIFSPFAGILSAENVISDYTTQKVEEFVNTRIALKSEDFNFAIDTINKLWADSLAGLSEQAKDLEQESCILDSMYFMEIYDRTLAAGDKRPDLRKKMKEQMKRNKRCVSARTEDEKPVSDWMYLFTGDVTSYYMTRSVAATLLHGLDVKGCYENAISVNPERASAHVSLGNWRFYAPGLFGGGKKRAQNQLDKAVASAKIPGEQYMSYLSYSQVNYERGNTDVAKEYLDKAKALGLGQKELDLIERCNEKGYSYFQYLRNRSGIDKEMAEDEKDEDDK